MVKNQESVRAETVAQQANTAAAEGKTATDKAHAVPWTKKIVDLDEPRPIGNVELNFLNLPKRHISKVKRRLQCPAIPHRQVGKTTIFTIECAGAMAPREVMALFGQMFGAFKEYDGCFISFLLDKQAVNNGPMFGVPGGGITADEPVGFATADSGYVLPDEGGGA